MYCDYWKLRSQPFENRCEDDSYYPADSHQTALLKLRYAIENRRAAALLCGPSGVGKTMLINALHRQLPEQFRPFCQLVFPMLTGDQLLQYLVQSLVPEGSIEAGPASVLARFDQFLRGNLEAKRHLVIVVDEAQLLEQNDLLEPLRLLLNVAAERSPGESAWTLILAGQLTLLSQVERCHALDERFAVKCLVNRFSPEETNAYILHRLRVAGGIADKIFTTGAIDAIHNFSHGIPRRINRLADLALMVGYAEDLNLIDTSTIESVHDELGIAVKQ